MPYESETKRFPSVEAAAFYLAALLDGEGSVSGGYHPITGKLRSRRVAIHNTDLSIIDAAVEACAILNIDAKVYAANPANTKWKRRYDVKISRRLAIERFAAVVPVQCSVKKEKLAELLASYERAGYGRWRETLTPEFLYQEYVVKGKSYTEISRETGCPIPSLAYRIRAAGIATRHHHNQYTDRRVA